MFVLFKYQIKNKEIRITRYIGFDTILEIPSEIVGLPVTSIGSCAFESCKTLESVTIPDTVQSIKDYAFFNCKNLNEVNFKGDASIEYHVFKGCNKLEKGFLLCRKK